MGRQKTTSAQEAVKKGGRVMDPLDPRDMAAALAEAQLRGNVAAFQQNATERIRELEHRVAVLATRVDELTRMTKDHHHFDCSQPGRDR